MSVIDQRATSRFDRWTSGFFLVLAVVAGAAAVFVAVTVGVPQEALIAGLGLPVGIAALATTAWGLTHGLVWARWAAVRILWILIALGAIRFVLTLTTSVVIPIEAIVAAVILAATRPEDRASVVTGRDWRIAVGIVLAVVLANLWWLLMAPAAGIDPLR